jgi:hypothetical protein
VHIVSWSGNRRTRGAYIREVTESAIVALVRGSEWALIMPFVSFEDGRTLKP